MAVTLFSGPGNGWYTNLPKVFVPINTLCHKWQTAEISCELHVYIFKLVRNIAF